MNAFDHSSVRSLTSARNQDSKQETTAH